MSAPPLLAPLRIGARSSPLSLAQTRGVRAQLGAALGIAEEDWERLLPILGMTTSGDRLQDGRLTDFGGKGLFTKELDEALLDGRIDLGVHSMKDLPAELPEGVVLAATPLREDPRDAFICRIAASLKELPEGARVGTSSVRRQAQTLHRRGDLLITPMRGNVDTRLAKLARGDADATYLAAAGLNRLGKAAEITSFIDPEIMPPAPCQGALALTVRSGDSRAFETAQLIQDGAATLETTAERALLAALGGSCRTPIAALARARAGGRLFFLGEVLSEDGKRACHDRYEEAIRTVKEAHELGIAVGCALKEAAVDELGWPA